MVWLQTMIVCNKNGDYGETDHHLKIHAGGVHN